MGASGLRACAVRGVAKRLWYEGAHITLQRLSPSFRPDLADVGRPLTISAEFGANIARFGPERATCGLATSVHRNHPELGADLFDVASYWSIPGQTCRTSGQYAIRRMSE